MNQHTTRSQSSFISEATKQHSLTKCLAMTEQTKQHYFSDNSAMK